MERRMLSADDAALFNALELWYSERDIERQRLVGLALQGFAWAQDRVRHALLGQGTMDPTPPHAGPGPASVARGGAPQ